MPAKYTPEEAVNAFWARVDKSSECWLWTTGRYRNGYGMCYFNGRTQGAHRAAYEIAVGPIPAGYDIDHICHTRLCVNPNHLRPTTRKQNLENKSGPLSNNTSGYLGISWHKSCGKWRGTVRHNGRQYEAGCFHDIDKAASAVTKMRLALFTHNDADRVA